MNIANKKGNIIGVSDYIGSDVYGVLASTSDCGYGFVTKNVFNIDYTKDNKYGYVVRSFNKI